MEIFEKVVNSIDSGSLRIFTVILSIGLLAIGILANGYGETEEKAKVLCLSCLGLNPKTVLEFRFETANGEKHPDFVLKPLEDKPVFLDYSQDGCSACDAMRPKIKELEEEYGDKINFIGEINLDHTTQQKKESYEIYDYRKQNSVPMFVVITLGYSEEGKKPCYATGYGYLNKDSPKEAKKVLADLFEQAIGLYEQNKG